MKEIVFSSPFFGITISIVAYSIGVWLNKKTKMAIINPLLISYVIIIPLLVLLNIPLEWYKRGGDIINMFLSPATAVLAITVYRQRKLLKDHILSVIVGSIAGSLTSLLVVYALCRLLLMPDEITVSMLPKSITTPMAIAVSESLGGIEAVTVLAVIITGISGNILGPILIKVFRIKNEIAQGMAMGAASHAVGTSKAIELGEVQGALSSIALVMSGIITVILSLIFFL
ncbi:MAG TPA: LrgB family protein [Candidatus Ornithospirochaeta stercorigallinarum]|nr:LrgB family protein [Candidatus Ornithospirochaeta stercorigallinarum]